VAVIKLKGAVKLRLGSRRTGVAVPPMLHVPLLRKVSYLEVISLC
jgi:hypothetical protein